MPALPLLLIAYLGFVSLSLPDVVLGVAWPSLRDEFGVSQRALGAILFGFGAGYFLASLNAGRLIALLGVGRLLTLSSATVLAALGCYVLTPLWAGMLFGALLLGVGSGAIDVGLNIYAARYFSAGQMNWLHASWGLGAALGPWLMTATLAAGGGWRDGYLLIGALLSLMTLLFALTRKRWRRAPCAGGGAGALALLRRPAVAAQVALFFCYTGIEAGVGLWSFTLYSEGRGVALATAGFWVGLYWAALTAGRVLSGFIVDRLGTGRLLTLASAGLAAAALLLTLPLGGLGWLALALFGLSLAPFFPCLTADTPRRLGAVADSVIGYQMGAALLGAALLPALIGVLAARYSLAAVGPALALLGALFVALYFLLERLTEEQPRADDEPDKR